MLWILPVIALELLTVIFLLVHILHELEEIENQRRIW